jgi:hypothetical protein
MSKENKSSRLPSYDYIKTDLNQFFNCYRKSSFTDLFIQSGAVVGALGFTVLGILEASIVIAGFSIPMIIMLYIYNKYFSSMRVKN